MAIARLDLEGFAWSSPPGAYECLDRSGFGGVLAQLCVLEQGGY